MGNLLSLNPKIHRLRADAQEDRSFRTRMGSSFMTAPDGALNVGSMKSSV
jgi:hypothetical protein